MNDDNSDRTEDGSRYVFIRDKNSNPSEYYQTSPSAQCPSVSHGDWNSDNPDAMVVDYEMDPAVDSSESVSLSHLLTQSLPLISWGSMSLQCTVSLPASLLHL